MMYILFVILLFLNIEVILSIFNYKKIDKK